MPRNLTISISDELASRMDTMPEINWSEVCRQAISRYIEEVRKGTASASTGEKVELMVEDAKDRDVARGIARIDQPTMEKLQVSAGVVIEISGKRRTSAIAWPAYSEDQNRGVIRIDGFIRKSAGISINERVIVRRAEVKDALGVVLAPVDMRLNVDDDFTNFVKNRLMERSFCEGDTTLVMMLGHPVQFIVTQTRPRGIVRMTYETKLQILNEPAPAAPSLVQVELTSVDELEEIGVEVEVLEKGYDILNKKIGLKMAISVRFGNSVHTSLFDTHLEESTRLSDLLDAYRRKAVDQLENVKTDIRISCEQAGFPINLNLADIGKVIAEKIT